MKPLPKTIDTTTTSQPTQSQRKTKNFNCIDTNLILENKVLFRHNDTVKKTQLRSTYQKKAYNKQGK